MKSFAIKMLLLCIFGSIPPATLAQQGLPLNGIVTLGDSLTAGLAGDGRGGFTCAAQGGRPLSAAQQSECRGNGGEGVGGWQPRLKQLSQTAVYNYGNSGEQTASILARLNAAMAAQPSTHVLILAGTNDTIRGSVPAATDNIREMIRRVRLGGKIPIVATLPPLSGSVVAGSNAQVQQLNANIRNLPSDFPGLLIVDIYLAVVDSWAQQTSGDFIHFGDVGNRTVADLWFEAIQQSVAVPEQAPVTLAPLSMLLLTE